MTVQILIADDSRSVRNGLHGLLEQHEGWKVCADAVDGSDAVSKALQFKPDVIVLDFFMPGMTGVEAARILDKALPAVPILMVTLELTNQLIEEAKSVGIKGAVQKSDTGGMVNGVEALLRQETFFKSQPPIPVS